MNESLGLELLSEDELITLYEKVEEHKQYLVDSIINDTVPLEEDEPETLTESGDEQGE